MKEEDGQGALSTMSTSSPPSAPHPARLGLFGGTFDPWHLGHELVLQRVQACALVDEILVVPAGRPPHKPVPTTPFAQRLAMVQAALAGRPQLQVLDIEDRLPPPSYTLHTVRLLRERCAPGTLVLILGADSFLDLHRWYGAAELLTLVELLVLSRPPWSEADLAQQERRLREITPPGEKMPPLHCVAGLLCALSSSEVRRRLAAGDDPAGLVPPAVAAYIQRHRLYGMPR